MRGRTAVEFWSETLRALKLATSVVAVTVGAFIPYYWLQLWSGALRWLQRPWLIRIWRCVLVRTIHRTFASQGAGSAHYAAGRFTEAVGYGRQGGAAGQGFSGGHRIYVARLAQDGQIDEARTALDRLRELQPKISVAWIEQNAPWTAGPAQIRRRHAQGGIGPLSCD
jgi:hypothetical protein